MPLSILSVRKSQAMVLHEPSWRKHIGKVFKRFPCEILFYNKISSFQQLSNKSIREAWERMQEYVAACPHHGMGDWLFIQNFYHGLTSLDRSHLDAATSGEFFSLKVLTLLDRSHLDATTSGEFFSLKVPNAKALIEKMVSNQGWNEEHYNLISKECILLKKLK